jgi:4-hydroxybenzoate polyprenyltransferase
MGATLQASGQETSGQRWWIYQRERFPLVAHGILIAAFSSSAVGYSSLLRDAGLPARSSLLVAFASSFLFFLQLRILDEFKDYEEDAQYRPYRPVPRGVVTLRELGRVGLATAGIQAALAVSLDRRLVLLLGATWIYMLLMSREFFVGEWLRAHPALYLWSHMLIIPIVTLYATACDWIVAGSGIPDGVGVFLMASFFNAIGIEIGRKVRAPADEEQGVTTYSAAWGVRWAVCGWMLALSTTAALALLAAARIAFATPVAFIVAVSLSTAATIAWRFLRWQERADARRIEYMSAVWTLLMYLSLGVAPLFMPHGTR